jgi:hypothetical protein
MGCDVSSRMRSALAAATARPAQLTNAWTAPAFAHVGADLAAWGLR